MIPIFREVNDVASESASVDGYNSSGLASLRVGRAHRFRGKGISHLLDNSRFQRRTSFAPKQRGPGAFLKEESSCSNTRSLIARLRRVVRHDAIPRAAAAAPTKS